MAALSSTTLAAAVDATSERIKLTSATGVSAGTYLFTDGELLVVVAMNGVFADVRRGQGGTAGTPHASGVTVYLGTANQFYNVDPAGDPPNPPLTTPWINVVENRMWAVNSASDPTAWVQTVAGAITGTTVTATTLTATTATVTGLTVTTPLAIGTVLIMTGAGAPVDGTTGDNVAGIGSLYLDTTAGDIYVQTAVITAPVWKLVTRAA